MTTESRQQTISDAAAAPTAAGRHHTLGWIGYGFYILRRWPIIPALIIITLLICAVFAHQVAPHDPYVNNLLDRNTAPLATGQSGQFYLLGSDFIGRDLLSRIIHGARISAMVVVVSITVGVSVGTTCGLLAGYFGRHIDEIIMRIVDVWAALPFIMLALIVVSIFGQDLRILIALLALISWPGAVRLVRAQTLSLRESDYVQFARVAGASSTRILLRHILPGVINIVVVSATLGVGGIILTEATLSYLAVGIPPPTPAWGAMVANGREYIGDAWWLSAIPGMAIFLVVMAGNFLGDWMRDRWDPNLRQLD
ncbi:MAG: ABC transporter permease [Chloroflexi bacterium]|nr:ABC transporter permease [Chloroflexota bacterium]MYF78701.1 ABC transporter permease [Chloroflexota bacterium]MYK61596.1 ABC transporter permease [Chloroflexota bacterium]